MKPLLLGLLAIGFALSAILGFLAALWSAWIGRQNLVLPLLALSFLFGFLATIALAWLEEQE